MISIKNRIKAFGHAFRGVVNLSTEPHFRIHLLAALLVILAAWYWEVSATHWAILMITCALVLSAEGLNSALEHLADAVHPEHHPLVKKAKDIAAAAVLISAIFAVLVALFIFTPYIQNS